MSLQVWLPLTGHLNNQGLSNITVTNNGATVDNNGKIGKCYSFTPGDMLSLPPANIKTFTEMSVSLWLNITAWNASWETYFQFGLGTQPWNSYTFGLSRNNSASNICFTISNGSTSTSTQCASDNLTIGTWYHVTCVYKTGHCLFYINGSLVKDLATSIVPNFSDISYITFGRINSANYYTNCKMNDIRIYDHALSEKEVKELAKGLVLHYPLTGGGRSGDNLVAGTKAIEQSYTYPVSSYSDKFRAKPANPTTASQYTLSFYAKSTVNGDKIRSHWYDPNTTKCVSSQGVTYAASDGQMDYTLSTEWEHYWCVYTQSETTSAKTLIFPRILANNGTGTVSVKCVKLEEGDHATPWMPNSADAAYVAMGYNSTTEYDVSGYNNHGTKTNITYSSDTARYAVASMFNGTDSNITVPFNTIVPEGSVFTVNLWFKKDALGSKNYETLFGGPSGFEMDTRAASATTLSLYMASVRGGNIFSPFEFNKWYMVTMVSDGTNEMYYVNGDLKKTITKQSMPVGNYFLGCWRNTTSQNYYGLMSDFRIYATALSAEDVKQLYNTAAALCNNGTLFAYDFVEV